MWLCAGLLLLCFGGADGVICTPTTPEEPVCLEPVDCEGLPKVTCAGHWTCDEGQCLWVCEPPGPAYTLHEWGVFKTGGTGADVSTTPSPYVGPVPAKPIIYLYSDEEFELDVAVDFASGQATEVWPEIPMGQSIAWDGVQVSNGNCPTTPFPEAGWDSDPPVAPEVTQLGPLVVDEASCLTFGNVVSRLLFYTGQLPEYQAPLSATYQFEDDGESLLVALTNSSDEEVKDLMLVLRLVDSECIDPSGCWVHFAALAHGTVDAIPPGTDVTVSLPVHQVLAVDENMGGGIILPVSWQGQSAQLDAKLQELGLSSPEADAFMYAWTDVFFGVFSSSSTFFMPEYGDGLFLIYPLSTKAYDEQLALTVSVPPEERVRVGYVYHRVPATACWPAQVEKDGVCQCPQFDGLCSPWCWEGDADCKPGTFNDVTCACDPIEPM